MRSSGFAAAAAAAVAGWWEEEEEVSPLFAMARRSFIHVARHVEKGVESVSIFV